MPFFSVVGYILFLTDLASKPAALLKRHLTLRKNVLYTAYSTIVKYLGWNRIEVRCCIENACGAGTLDSIAEQPTFEHGPFWVMTHNNVVSLHKRRYMSIVVKRGLTRADSHSTEVKG